MGIYSRPDSPLLWWSVTIDGHRFRGCCGTASRDEAKRVLKREKARLQREYPSGRRPELSLEAAFTRYADEHAIHLRSAPDIARIGETVIGGLGSATLLSRLTGDDLAAFVARRRRAVSDSSVNRELTILRAVLRMAARRWCVAVAEVDWEAQFLLEPAPRDRVLSAAEEERLFAALRPDFHGLVRFALATGIRLDNIITLRWRQVSWDERVIRLRIKSRRPGGDTHAVPITPRIAAILSAEQGRHPDRVFTYVVRRARSDDTRAVERVSGQREPFTAKGWRKSWYAALAEAAIEDLHFHDLRHTFATRLFRQTRNLRLVQKWLGHRSIETTIRYENSSLDDLREAVEAAEKTPAPRRPARTTGTRRAR